MTGEDLARALLFEQEWDPKMGGPQTRPYRQILGYTACSILRRGAKPTDVVGYLEQLLQQFMHDGLIETLGGREASS